MNGQSKPSDSVADLGGDWLTLGGVDLQINGGLGLAIPDLTPEHLPVLKKISRYLWAQGVDGYVPTIVTAAVTDIQQSLRVLADYMQAQPTEQSAQVLGAHLEGPCLNYEKRGAHPPEHLMPLDCAHLQTLLGEYAGIVRIMTLAPELDPTGASIEYLCDRNIIVSLGHSLATEAEANRAYAQGATMVTHAFNAMPSLHHRRPGLLGAAMINPAVHCGFIADGQHVSPTVLKLFLRSCDHPFLVSDALAPLGLPDGTYPWDTRKIIVTNGTARLDDQTLAGTTHPLLTGVENLARWGICDPEAAITLATHAPRKALGIVDLGIGQSVSNLLRWTDDANSLKWERLSLHN